MLDTIGSKRLVYALFDVALDPYTHDTRYVRELDDGTFEVFVFEDDEIHLATFSLSEHLKMMTVLTVTRVRFEDGAPKMLGPP
jgi:hypothetical protein